MPAYAPILNLATVATQTFNYNVSRFAPPSLLMPGGNLLRINRDWARDTFRYVVSEEMNRASNDTGTKSYTVLRVDNANKGDPLQATNIIRVVFGPLAGKGIVGQTVGPPKEAYILLNVAPGVMARVWDSFGVRNRTGKLRTKWHWEITPVTSLVSGGGLRIPISIPQQAYPLRPRWRILLRFDTPYAAPLSMQVAGRKRRGRYVKITSRFHRAKKGVRARARSATIMAADILRNDPVISSSWLVRAVNQGVGMPWDRSPRWIGLMFTPRRVRTIP